MAYDKVVDSAVLDEGLKQIADAIREKAGTTDALAFPQAMADAIAAIQGGGATIEPLTISENGTYTAPDGVDGYSPVTVYVKGSGEELVITDFSYFCYKGTRLSVLDQFDTSNGTKFSYMFADFTNLTDVPMFDTANGKDFSYMFKNCSRIETVPTFDTSNGNTFSNMFSNCSSLTAVPQLNVSNGSNFSSMFSYAYKITTIPELNTSKGSVFNYMFESCSALTTISGLNMNKSSSSVNMFESCKSLEYLYLYNIRKTIKIGSGTSWGHLLTVDSLVHTIKELCTVTSSQTLTIGSANLEKIAGLYCRITDDTNEKKPMELCEGTDEGAMTLTEYATAKGWQIK